MAQLNGSKRRARLWRRATSSQLLALDARILALHDRGLSACKISTQIGWSQGFVSGRLIKHGRTGLNYRYMEKLTVRQRSILVGSILGDGHLTMPPPHKNAGLYLGHGAKQRKYLIWKARELGTLFKSLKPHKQVYSPSIVKYALQSRHHPVLTAYYKSCVRKKGRRKNLNAKKITKHLLDQVDDLALAIWWADDGGCDVRNSLGTNFHFAVGGCTEREYVLVEKWLEREGFPTRRYTSNTNCIKLWMQRDVSARFEARISPHLPECIKYKLRR